jgi:hypothetical protein
MDKVRPGAGHPASPAAVLTKVVGVNTTNWRDYERRLSAWRRITNGGIFTGGRTGSGTGRGSGVVHAARANGDESRLVNYV